ncbi:RHS repeat-associated core domain-containing protein [Nonomuraea sp. NPDC005692]|uniref:RHS repeat-associated core domain-containing protein n=1 Tax=Nonomuraea sp. NPDC005692 TaxID=3157168 RepID=UPI0033DAF6B2
MKALRPHICRVRRTGTRYYSHGGQVVAVRSGGTAAGVSWLSGDHHGTTGAAIANTDGQAVATRRHTPFGEPRDGGAGTWPASMDRGFVGGTSDGTGLTHLGAREYDPGTGRFVSVDPLVDVQDSQQVNGYTYANNNPLALSDPDGRMPRSCPDGVCNDGKGGGAHQNRENNPADSYNPPVGGGVGGGPCAPADGQAGTRPRGDNLLPKGGPCGARPCHEYEQAPFVWHPKKYHKTVESSGLCDGLFNCGWEVGWRGAAATNPLTLIGQATDDLTGTSLTPDYVTVDESFPLVPSFAGFGLTSGITVSKYGQVTVNVPLGSAGVSGPGVSARMGWTNVPDDKAAVNGFLQGAAVGLGGAVPRGGGVGMASTYGIVVWPGW